MSECMKENPEQQLLLTLITQLEISVYSPHILYIIFTYI